MKISLDFTQSLEKNAQKYFEKSKKSKKKLEGAVKALEKSKKKLEKTDKIVIQKSKKLEDRKRRKKEWYEKFHWFKSSDGFLIVAGKDSTTNEIVIKKYAETGDKVLHTDMAGSPFVVVKSNGEKIPSSTIKEAGEFVLVYSRAWKNGMTTAAVFCVNPDQVSKTAKSGESLPKGAFMIYGQTDYLDNPEMSFAVGIKDNEISGGPVSAIKKHCEKYVEVIQGKDKATSTAKKIKIKIGGEIDDIVRVLPAGGTDIK